MKRGCVLLLFCAVVTAQAARADVREKEMALGAHLAAETRRNSTVIEDPVVRSFVDGIGARLVAQLPHPKFNYTFAVIRSDMRLPFAFPGGYVFVTSASILNAQTEAEFAQMLGRAIGDIELNHGMRVIGDFGQAGDAPLIFMGGIAGDNVQLPKRFEEARRAERAADDAFALQLIERADFAHSRTPELSRAQAKLQALLAADISRPPTLRRPRELLFAAPAPVINPATLPAIGTVDRRFQSYNIEMLEVTGGRFWKPYKDLRANSAASASDRRPGPTPAGMNPNLYEYRPPIDLSNRRLRKLAAALGPAYVRVSGTWANTTYFYDADGPAPATPPQGFNGVLTRAQWKGVIDFAQAANAEIVTSFATSAGTRNAAGVWTPEQARALLAYTKSVGGKIAAAAFMNEPTFAAIGGAPKGYDAAAFARDIAVFRPFLKKTAPDVLFLGPGGVGEGGTLSGGPAGGRLRSEDLLQATGPVYDIFSYHLYAAASQRCAGANTAFGTTAA